MEDITAVTGFWKALRAFAAGMVTFVTLDGAASAAPAPLPDWKGPWVYQGSTNFDPTVPQGVRQKPPLNAEYQKLYDSNFEANRQGQPNVLSDPTASCQPAGFPRIMRAPFPFEIIVRPEVIYVLFEYMHEVRRIHTDGRRRPASLDLTYNGHSVGRWEGDTLVVDTVGLRPGNFDQNGVPHSDQLRVEERIRRPNPDLLEVEFTLTDPKAFTGPWVVKRQYKREPSFGIEEYVCVQNNRNAPDAAGLTNMGAAARTPAEGN